MSNSDEMFTICKLAEKILIQNILTKCGCGSWLNILC